MFTVTTFIQYCIEVADQYSKTRGKNITIGKEEITVVFSDCMTVYRKSRRIYTLLEPRN